MRENSQRSINRRSFMKFGLAAAGSIFVMGAGNSFATENNTKETTHWAFLSDTHIPADVNNRYRGFYPYKNLQTIVPDIASARPQGVTIAGDLARLTGELDDYANLKKLINPLAEQTPIFMALGNHDNRDNFVKVFENTPGQKQPVKGKHVVVVNKKHARLIVLDSLLYVNKVAGLLGKAQRQWLEAYLQQCDDTPTLLCFHHTLEDGDGDLLDVPRLFDMIKPIRKVKALVFGHSHAYGYSKFEDIHLINLPAVGYNFDDAQPVGWVEAYFKNKGGDFVLHAAGGNKDMDSRTTSLTWR
ncbi:MAG: metallophosphoesterase [Sedimentisphaerales bacterium]|nr:metallophosphoesterase [Sedimentisphaerales bacterium]